MLIINIGCSTVSSAVKIANHPNSVPEASSFDALISAVPVFPAKRMSSRWAAYPVPLESFLHIDLHSFCFADMVNNKSSGIHACMKCHLTSISIETIVEMVIFYFQCTLYLQNITFVRFWSEKIPLLWIYRTIHSSSLFYYICKISQQKNIVRTPAALV